MGISFWQILIVVALLVLLFGRGKISELMGDVAKGVKSFKKGIKEEDETKSINKSDDNSNKEKHKLLCCLVLEELNIY